MQRLIRMGRWEWLAPFRVLFTQTTWQGRPVLASGAILTTHRRTVSAALRVTERADDAGFSHFHEVPDRGRSSALVAVSLLLVWLVAMLAPAGPMMTGLDDTIERRWGAQTAGRGVYCDPEH